MTTAATATPDMTSTSRRSKTSRNERPQLEQPKETPMAITITCKRCREPIVAVDEDDLVARVQAHARDHGGAHGKHMPTREHILSNHRRHGHDNG